MSRFRGRSASRGESRPRADGPSSAMRTAPRGRDICAPTRVKASSPVAALRHLHLPAAERMAASRIRRGADRLPGPWNTGPSLLSGRQGRGPKRSGHRPGGRPARPEHRQALPHRRTLTRRAIGPLRRGARPRPGLPTSGCGEPSPTRRRTTSSQRRKLCRPSRHPARCRLKQRGRQGRPDRLELGDPIAALLGRRVRALPPGRHDVPCAAPEIRQLRRPGARRACSARALTRLRFTRSSTR